MIIKVQLRFSQYFGWNQWGQNKNNFLSDVGNFNTQTYQGKLCKYNFKQMKVQLPDSVQLLKSSNWILKFQTTFASRWAWLEPGYQLFFGW